MLLAVSNSLSQHLLKFTCSPPIWRVVWNKKGGLISHFLLPKRELGKEKTASPSTRMNFDFLLNLKIPKGLNIPLNTPSQEWNKENNQKKKEKRRKEIAIMLRWKNLILFLSIKSILIYTTIPKWKKEGKKRKEGN